MILRIRAFLIFLLVLLQFVAPLIHAHKNNVANLGVSVHLPEFEHVNSLLKHAPQFVAQTNHDGEIVAISTGIKNETLQILQTENTIFMLLVGLFLMVNVARKPCNFLFQTEPILDSHFFNFALPRAPPFSYLR
jgi:hypothetical protein